MSKSLTLISLIVMACRALDFSSASYQSQSSSVKLNQLWNEISANTESGSYPSALGQAKVFIESMKPSLNFVSDMMPEGRSKLIHSVGVVV